VTALALFPDIALASGGECFNGILFALFHFGAIVVLDNRD